MFDRVRAACRGVLVLSALLLAAVPAAAEEPGTAVVGSQGIEETTAEIMERQERTPARIGPRPEIALKKRDRSSRPQDPAAIETDRWPPSVRTASAAATFSQVYTTASAFDGPTLTDTASFPPDTMGAVGPTQVLIFLNGRLRTYTRAGVADGQLNVDPDVFFSSAMTPVAPPVTNNFTSDPQARYDRFTGRWYVSIIDVPMTAGSLAANRWMLAVSDASSNGTITGSTVWTFFHAVTHPTLFCDYPSLGIDVHALYFGCNMFSTNGNWSQASGFVVRKASVLEGGPIEMTRFDGLAVGSGAGPYTPRGVDNLDPAATAGYFIGVDNAEFGRLTLRRVSNPGGDVDDPPTISDNLGLTVLSTNFSDPVEHAGNTGGTNGRLDSIDDRLYAAMIRNGRLWTAHNLRASAAGSASLTAQSRNAVRWYEVGDLDGTPTLVQAGTVHDDAANRADARQYFIPTIAVTGQGHAVVGFTMAGAPVGATPAYTARLASDPPGTMAGVPGTGVVAFGTSAASYNPPLDGGGSRGRRWGDYSATLVDPFDDMSVWTIQEYNHATNSYAVRVARLLGPPPATPDCLGDPIPFTGPTGQLVITGTSVAGSAFYDPGQDPPPPALPLHHLDATMTNATVDGLSYDGPTQITLTVHATAEGLQDVTITNPDGQSVTAVACVEVTFSPLIFEDDFESGDTSAWASPV